MSMKSAIGASLRWVLRGPLGYEGKRTGTAVSWVREWIELRQTALQGRRAVFAGHAVELPDRVTPGLRPVEVLSPGHGEVTVRIASSVVSPGTERARLLGLPNAHVNFPHRPGYSGAGEVWAVGPGVTDVAVGDRVAVRGARHQSVVTVDAAQVFALPGHVALADASAVQLGVIAGQGVHQAALQPGEPFAVIGAGMIGVLAQRLASADGAGPATIIANTSSRRRVASGDDVRFVAAVEEPEVLEQLEVPCVIDASGDPRALATALRIVADGGRIVLLGSNRGGPDPLPVAELRARRVRLVGAHVETLKSDAAVSGEDTGAREVGRFVGALAEGRMRIDDLFDVVADPREPALLYRRLIEDPSLVGVRFDWNLLAEGDQVRRSSLLALPDVAARGVDQTAPPAPVRAPAGADPFDGAVGDLRFGIIGCGEIAVRNAAAVAGAPNARPLAFYDPEPRLAQELASVHDGDAMPSLEALLGRADVDAVFISVPHHLHAPLAVQAARAGKHVLVEKPPANSLAAAAEMVRVAGEAGVTLSVCFPHRYSAAARAARRAIDGGALGEFDGVRLTWLDDKPTAYLYGGHTGRTASTWRASREQAGGGVMIMNLSHYVDLARHLSGVEIEEVYAVASSTAPPAEIEDTIAVTVRYEGGAPGSFLAGSRARGRSESEVRLWGVDGHVEIEPEPKLFTLHALAGVRTGRWHELTAPAAPQRALLVSRFASAVTEGREPEITAQDALAVQAVMEAIYRSADTATAVRPADLLKRVQA